MDEEKENFLKRWSRLKRDEPRPPEEPMSTAGTPATAGIAAPTPSPAQLPTELPTELPAAESLGFSSDFTAYMQAGVDTGLRRAALQKLFHAEHFNVMDGLDVYIDDYNSFEPVGAELLRNLNQARGLLFDDAQTQAGTEPSEPAVEPDSDPIASPPNTDIATDKPE